MRPARSPSVPVSLARWIGGALALSVVAAAAVAPVLTAHEGTTIFRGYAYAPPMWPHLRDDEGRWRRPFVYPLRPVDPIERRFEVDRTRPVPLVWFARGAIVAPAHERYGPWLPLGGDVLGRDLFARLVLGSRVSLGIALLAVAGALVLGSGLGTVAGWKGGALDETLMRTADLAHALPTLYVVIVLRAALPLTLPTPTLFLLIVVLFSVVGCPTVARGVRALVRSERARDYALAARAAGASDARLLLRHLLPATVGFLAAHALLLLPAFVLAEATLSFVGLGFPADTPTWGTLLRDAGHVTELTTHPWLLAPAAAIVLLVLGLNLLLHASSWASARASGL